jgi:hypothetical protein
MPTIKNDESGHLLMHLVERTALTPLTYKSIAKLLTADQLTTQLSSHCMFFSALTVAN